MGERRVLIDELMFVVDYDQFWCWFQFVVDWVGGVVGFEFLLCWEYFVRGIVGFGVFLFFMVFVGMDEQVDAIVLEQLIVYLVVAVRAVLLLLMNVNVMFCQIICFCFVMDLLVVVCWYGVLFDVVCLEIIESDLLRVDWVVVEVLVVVCWCGFQVVIDDFGTGYFSLFYLFELFIDILKIDCCFIGGLGFDLIVIGLVVVIVSFIQSLGFYCVVEGVEIVAQRDELDRFGCLLCQGWLYALVLFVDESVRYAQVYFVEIALSTVFWFILGVGMGLWLSLLGGQVLQ